MNEDYDREAFWEHIAFYNFIQRPMDYSFQERPTEKDFYRGWAAFLSIIDIIKPTDCIFIGVSASNYFTQSMSILGLDEQCSSVEWLEGQGAYARRFSIKRPWGEVTPICIKHTSSYYSYEYWHEFLLKYNKTAMKFIYSVQNHDFINIEHQPSIEKHASQKREPELPCHLSHRPILACDYRDIEGDDTDAYYLSLGRAQYDNEHSASIKIWRHGENRWSRQSEEIPIARIPDLTLLLVSAIKTFTTLDYCTGFTYLHEQYVKEDDMFFIKQCISSESPRIKKSLSELKKLLNGIDIDSL